MAMPQEIIDEIIKAVATDKDSLDNCSLVCSSFLLPCRRHRWYAIPIRLAHPECEGYYQLFVENAVLRSFVRRITIYDDNVPGDCYDKWNQFLVAFLRLPFCRLRYLLLFLWDIEFNSELKDAISAIIHSSSFEPVCVSNLDMPITIFQGIHAEKLYLNFRDLCRQSAPLTTAASEGGATTATHAVVDHCEWKGFEPVLSVRHFLCNSAHFSSLNK
jgi:hypothetical protein